MRSKTGMLMLVVLLAFLLVGMSSSVYAQTPPLPDMTQGQFKTELTNYLLDLRAATSAIYFNVLLYGAVANDSTDLGVPLQNAINAAAAAGGGVVWIPAGLYKQTTAVNHTSGVVIQGASWGYNMGVAGIGSPGRGTWIHIPASMQVVPLTLPGTNSTVRDLAYFHDQPTPSGATWSPTLYPFVIEVTGEVGVAGGGSTSGGQNNLIENVLLFNAYNGVRQLQAHTSAGEASGRLFINRLWGQIFNIGIEIDFAGDVVKIENVHFWPFWDREASVQTFTKAHVTGILSYRSDNPIFSNIFMFSCFYGFYFGSNNHGVTSLFQMTNVDLDDAMFGVFVHGPGGVTGQITNMTSGGGTTGLFSDDAFSHINATGVIIQNETGNCVRMQSTAILNLDTFQCNIWNTSLSNFPGVEAADSSTIKLGTQTYFNLGNGAPNIGGTGQIGRMLIGEDPLFYLGKLGTNPIINFDAFRYMLFNRVTDTFEIHSPTLDSQTGYLCLNNGVMRVKSVCP
jgi:hypothetical protein